MIAEPMIRQASRPGSTIPRNPPRQPDPAFDAIPRLLQLRDALAAPTPVARPSRWREPPVFFFTPQRQAALLASRSACTVEQAFDPAAAELPMLCASVEVRQAARAIPGLRDAAARRGSTALVELLSVPDDEVVLVIHPQLRRGFRMHVRGVYDIAQFHLLMIDAAGEQLPGPPLPWRFRTYCSEVHPVIPAGVPMTATARFQFFHPGALQADGTLPPGFRGCEHWLWGHQPLATVPRLDGERVVLLGEPAYRQTWDVERRFPAMPAEVRLVEVLSPFRVVERLSRLVGRPLPVPESSSAEVPTLARAA